MSEVMHTATLVLGEVHVVANRSGGDDYVFPRGKAIVIDDRLRSILAREIDEVPLNRDPDTDEVEIVEKNRFDFDKYDGDAPVGAIVTNASTVRSRRNRKEIIS